MSVFRLIGDIKLYFIENIKCFMWLNEFKRVYLKYQNTRSDRVFQRAVTYWSNTNVIVMLLLSCKG